MKNSQLIVLLFCLATLTTTTRAQKITGVGPVCITVSDMDRSIAFYTKVLSFRKLEEHEVYGQPYESLLGVFGLRIRIATLALGQQEIRLVDFLTAGGRPVPADARSNDLSFQHIAIVVSNMDSAYRQLRTFNVEHVSTGPQTLPASIPAAAGIRAFYFHDPDDHNLELIWFPEGKGDPRWQQHTGALFMGIDHTAIGIRSTDQSLAFFRDLLGLERKGDSWNKGTEQEHLNNVEGASLHITGLRSPAGPGVEFLEYLVPGPGKPYPADTRADDLWCWETILWTDDANLMYARLKENYTSGISGTPVTFSDKDAGFTRAFSVRDPDGHLFIIAEK